MSGLPELAAARPRERLFERGPAALSEPELLACVLGVGVAGADALELALELLRRHPAGGLARLSPLALAAERGMGESRAARLCAAFELATRWNSRPSTAPDPVDSPRRALQEFGAMADLRKEHFVALYLDACHRPLHRETVSVGTLTASLVHPREVFAPALERPAAALIVAHNHPSGDPEPSREDRETTRRLCEAGRILGLPVLDHLIVAARGFFSFRERGLIDA